MNKKTSPKNSSLTFHEIAFFSNFWALYFGLLIRMTILKKKTIMFLDFIIKAFLF